MILTLRTDNPVAEIGLYDPEGKQLHYHTWQTDRRLAKELLATLLTVFKKSNSGWDGLTGVVVFEGPGSFTGLRIGITTANTIAYGQEVPIVGARDDDWIKVGLERLAKGESDRIVLPHYGSEPNISTPRH